MLLRARLADLAREGRTDRDGFPRVEPLAGLVDRLTRASSPPTDTIDALLAVLEIDDELREGCRAYFTKVIRFGRLSPAIAELGLLPAHGLATELGERLVARFLPSLLPAHDGRELFARAFGAARFRAWLADVPDDRMARLFALLHPEDPSVRSKIVHESLRALDLLSHRLAAGGEDPIFTSLDGGAFDAPSPFLAQAEEVSALSAELRREASAEGAPPRADADAAPHARVLIRQCHDELARVRRRSPRTGATIRITYEIDRLEGVAGRISALLLAVEPGAWEARAALFKQLVLEGTAPGEVLALLSRASRLVAREIVAHAGKTGDHYITSTPAEWGKMWLRAAGGGLIVAFLAVLKSWIASLHAPPLIEALAFSLNYGVGFVVVLYLGLTIATKQPAFTAASLSAVIERMGRDGATPLAETITRLIRSQLAAVFGNVLAAFPAALALGAVHRAAFGAPVAAPEKAARLAHDLHPLHSPALLHAALTGVWLTIGGVAAGAVANSIVARRVVERVARSAPLNERLGAKWTTWIAQQIERRAGPIAGCLVLGALLGSTGAVGRAFGLDVDIRHVSFSTANLGLALSSLAPGEVDVVAAVAGLLGIGCLNLAVSFGCSLAIAWHARKPQLRRGHAMTSAVVRSLVAEGAGLLLPVGRTARAAASTEPPSRR